MTDITVTSERYEVRITDGTRTQRSLCASPGAAKRLATRLRKNPEQARKWLGAPAPVQLELPFETAPGIRPE